MVFEQRKELVTDQLIVPTNDHLLFSASTHGWFPYAFVVVVVFLLTSCVSSLL